MAGRSFHSSQCVSDKTLFSPLTNSSFLAPEATTDTQVQGPGTFLQAPRFPFTVLPWCPCSRVSPFSLKVGVKFARRVSRGEKRTEKKAWERVREGAPESLQAAPQAGSRDPASPPEIPRKRTPTLDTPSCSASRGWTPTAPGRSSSWCESSAPRPLILGRMELNLLAAQSQCLPFFPAYPDRQPQLPHIFGGCRNHSSLRPAAFFSASAGSLQFSPSHSLFLSLFRLLI